LISEKSPEGLKIQKGPSSLDSAKRQKSKTCNHTNPAVWGNTPKPENAMDHVQRQMKLSQEQ